MRTTQKAAAIAGTVIMLAASAGCGGGSDTTSEIRDNTEQVLLAVKDNDIAKLCTYYTDRLACAGSFATAAAALGDVKLGDLITDKEYEDIGDEVDSMKVRVSENGKTAWSEIGDDDPNKWVLVDGEWKLDWDDD